MHVDLDYRYKDAEPTHANGYLWPVVFKELERTLPASSSVGQRRRILDLGCGNGATSRELVRRGYDVVGVDPSESGIAQAKLADPTSQLKVASAYEDLNAEFGIFDAVISLEVIEHVMWPRKFLDTVLATLSPGGMAIISTPFHGYWKNLALAVSGKLDAHFTAMWDGGHIKFWSEKTLYNLLIERGFCAVRFRRVGRISPLAKSMIVIAHRPIG